MGSHSTPQSSAPDAWPVLSFEGWKDTYATGPRPRLQDFQAPRADLGI
jgi:hypothetical protein